MGDFEKLCSVSLSRINVYACLICGKYFQGRGNNTHAYTHSVSENHRVFLNLETKKFYCLPDNYEVIDASLGDILYVLNPTFTPELIKKLETSSREARAVKNGPTQVDIYYWPPKDGEDFGPRNREYRRKRRSKVDQERYFEEFTHKILSVNNFTYVRRALGLNNEAYEMVSSEHG